MSGIKYVKHNAVYFNSPKHRDRATRIFIDFFDIITTTQVGKGMRGHMILESIENPTKSIILTFWNTEEEMDKFYSSDNKILADLVEQVKHLFEKMPDRTDYELSSAFIKSNYSG